ncbi:MAG TPA: LysM peptidoglycan-binding domain-containing protein [Mycobacteriales bacterium]|jgi:hypothetical protein
MTFDTPLRTSAPSPFARSRRGVRLTRRGRALLVLVLVAVVLVAFSLGRTSASAGSAAAAARRAPRTAVVQPGETLWAIAHRVAPAADPRRTVALLTELNGLGSRPIVAGQRLVLPPG